MQCNMLYQQQQIYPERQGASPGRHAKGRHGLWGQWAHRTGRGTCGGYRGYEYMKTTSNNKTRKPCTSVRYLSQHRRSKWEAIQKKFTPVREAFKVKICDNVRGYLITTYRYCTDGQWIPILYSGQIMKNIQSENNLCVYLSVYLCVTLL